MQAGVDSDGCSSADAPEQRRADQRASNHPQRYCCREADEDALIVLNQVLRAAAPAGGPLQCVLDRDSACWPGIDSAVLSRPPRLYIHRQPPRRPPLLRPERSRDCRARRWSSRVFRRQAASRRQRQCSGKKNGQKRHCSTLGCSSSDSERNLNEIPPQVLKLDGTKQFSVSGFPP